MRRIHRRSFPTNCRTKIGSSLSIAAGSLILRISALLVIQITSGRKCGVVGLLGMLLDIGLHRGFRVGGQIADDEIVLAIDRANVRGSVAIIAIERTKELQVVPSGVWKQRWAAQSGAGIENLNTALGIFRPHTYRGVFGNHLPLDHGSRVRSGW